MPIISEIGRRSLKVRLLVGCIYAILAAGAVTMVYPLLLMLSGSVKSDADAWSIKAYPGFWFNDLTLFQKYVEAKYNASAAAAQDAWCDPVRSWRLIDRPPPVAAGLAAAFREFRAQLPAARRQVGFTAATGMLPRNLRAYRRWMERSYHGDVAAYNLAANQACGSWCSVRMPALDIGRYRNLNLPEAFRRQVEAWAATAPVEDLAVASARGPYVYGYLCGRYTRDIKAYNQAHGSSHASYQDVPWSGRAPASGLEREDWADFVRNRVGLALVRLAPSLEPAFRRFLKRQHQTAALFNKTRRTAFPSLDAVPFPAKLDDAPYLRQDFEAFVKSPSDCPLDALCVRGADETFRDFLAARPGGVPANYPGLGAVVAATDWDDCMEHKAAERWEFTKRNYLQVLDYLVTHGNGLLNTIIYCALAVALALLVNPLAAYALSRFKLPGTYKILLFCMATMAFPAEVNMIPGFLLLKRFPLLPLLAGVAVTVGAFLLLEKCRPGWKENWRALLSLALGLATGSLVVPAFGERFASVSLLNSFAALALPGMANGFSIFLLKGFFDSMPKELYEAADLDGAGEWTKFWMLTMNLSKPILAVIALGAFTSAYSAFMMALVIIPDQKMWTIMVWIFQLQTMVAQPVVYASLVIAAIPTFLIFALCQNLIIKGIVVPTEK